MLFNYIHWGPDPELVNIFGISIRYYGILFGGGLVLTIYVLRWIFKKEQLPAKNLEQLSTYGLIGIIAGARIGHCLFYEPSYYLSHPLEIILPLTFPADGGIEFVGYRGLASHGGILGLLMGVYFYSRKTKHAMIHTLDLITIVAGLSFGFIRLANFMNSEIIGRPTDQSWGVIFERVDNIPRHPAQLYEAISYLTIFMILMILYKKLSAKVTTGFFFGLGSVLFFTLRIIIEFVKENQVGFEEGMALNMGQLLSLPFIATGIGFMIYGLKTKNQQGTGSTILGS